MMTASQKRSRWSGCLGLGIGLLLSLSLARANVAGAQPGETVESAACRIVDSAAHSAGLPVDFLTRLIWTESRFHPAAISPAGAEGIAQFMPNTATDYALSDPYDPEQAIPKAAKLVVDLERQFGNLGLAAAAYNAGAARVAGWLAGSGSLPQETRSYVLALTGRAAEDWAAAGRTAPEPDPRAQSCIAVTALLRQEDDADRTPIAPWGVQLAGNFSKAVALASFDRARQRYAGIVGGVRPMILGTRMPSRGTRPFYRIFLPASSRTQADQLCGEILAVGGACVAVRT
jgi:hypothetical protein